MVFSAPHCRWGPSAWSWIALAPPGNSRCPAESQASNGVAVCCWTSAMAPLKPTFVLEDHISPRASRKGTSVLLLLRMKCRIGTLIANQRRDYTQRTNPPQSGPTVVACQTKWLIAVLDRIIKIISRAFPFWTWPQPHKVDTAVKP